MNKRDCNHGRQIGKCADCANEILEAENQTLRDNLKRPEKELEALRYFASGGTVKITGKIGMPSEPLTPYSRAKV
jgi:hypothetical protein